MFVCFNIGGTVHRWCVPVSVVCRWWIFQYEGGGHRWCIVQYYEERLTDGVQFIISGKVYVSLLVGRLTDGVYFSIAGRFIDGVYMCQHKEKGS